MTPAKRPNINYPMGMKGLVLYTMLSTAHCFPIFGAWHCLKFNNRAFLFLYFFLEKNPKKKETVVTILFYFNLLHLQTDSMMFHSVLLFFLLSNNLTNDLFLAGIFIQ